MTKQIEGQMSIFDLATWSGKTYPERSVVTKARISEPSLKKRQGSQIKTPLFLDLRGGGLLAVASWETDGASLGVYMMHSFGECPREERESTSSNVTGCPDKADSYTLKIRGGVEVDSAGKKAGKGALIQTELSATLGVSQDQTLITIGHDERSSQFTDDEITDPLTASDYKSPPRVAMLRT